MIFFFGEPSLGTKKKGGPSVRLTQGPRWDATMATRVRRIRGSGALGPPLALVADFLFSFGELWFF